MNIEEIKKTVTMTELVQRYGFKPNRSGFICCPFHNEKTPSMKINKDYFHCFGCGVSGDVFKFVQLMDNCSFKEAFIRLGGDWEEPRTAASKISDYHREIQKEKREEAEQKQKDRLHVLQQKISWYREIINTSEPLSTLWAAAVNNLQLCEYRYDELMDEIAGGGL